MAFSTIDFILIGIALLSILIGTFRGFIKELISLVTWVVAIIAAVMFTSPLSQYMTFTSVEMIRLVSAFLVIFIGIVFMGAVVNFAVGSVVRNTPFSVPDRVLGSFFGFARAIVLITILVLLGGLTPLPQAPWWQKSPIIAKFQVPALWLKEQLPEEHAKGFKFDEEIIVKEKVATMLKERTKKKG